MFSKLISNTLKGTALGLSLALFFVASAQAQSNSTGNLVGHAKAGEVITIQNAKTGFKRKLTVGKTGRYRAGSLPLGEYVVTVMHADGTVTVSKPASVRLGLTTRVE